MATVASAIVCDRLRLYGNRSLCDRLRSTIRDRLRSAIVCDRLRSYGNQPYAALRFSQASIKPGKSGSVLSESTFKQGCSEHALSSLNEAFTKRM